MVLNNKRLLGCALLLTVACGAAAVGGCKESAVKQKVGSDAGEPLGLSPQRASYVLAKVGDKTITLGDYAATLERMDRFDRLRYKTPARRQELLAEIITVELLAQEAERRGLDKDPQAQQAIREVLRDAMLRDARLGAREPTSFSDQEVRAYYESHKDLFTEPERRRLSHVVVSSQKKAQELLKKAREITDQEQWGKFVIANSEAYKTEKYEGPVEAAGDLGLVGPPGDARSANPRVDEALRAAVFAMQKVGEVAAEVVVDQHGKFHIVRLDGINRAHGRTLAEAERMIRIMLSQQDVAVHEQQLEQDLRKKYPVSIDQAALDQARVIDLSTMPEPLPGLPGAKPPEPPPMGDDDHGHQH